MVFHAYPLFLATTSVASIIISFLCVLPIATCDSHSQNKKLEWTVHGYGCLSYGKLQLMVSTVQMLILLQYNRSEVWSMEIVVCESEFSISEWKYVLVLA